MKVLLNYADVNIKTVSDFEKIHGLICDKKNHCVKIVRIRSYSGPYFLAFGLNTGKCEPE